ncbi:MAG: site-2 protease family protein [Nibricoccus sp.]
MELLHNILSNLWAVFLVILFFGGSIFVHELGHFLAARRRGMHVDRFSIGFGPKIFSWHGKDGVEYRISWLPLGGYVALPQLADMRGIEGETRTDLSKLPQPSYTTKVIVSAAGAFCNIVFAFVLGLIVWKITGEPTSNELVTTTVAEVRATIPDSTGKEVPSPASLAGLKPGDTILKIDGRPVTWFGEIVEELALSSGRTDQGERLTTFTIKRGDQVFDLALNPIRSGDEKLRRVGFTPVEIIKLGPPKPGSIAEKIGLLKGDRIVAANQKTTLSVSSLVEELKLRIKGAVSLTVERGAETKTFFLPPATDVKEAADIGIQLQSGVLYTHPNPLRQIYNAAMKTVRTLVALVNPRADVSVANLSSPIGIISNFFDLAKEGMPFVLWFTILVNVNLAIFNLLPIPVLDGGHILFATIAKLRGKSLPADFVAATQSVFMVLLLSIMVYAGYRDVRRRTYSGEERPAKAAPAQNESAPPPATPSTAPAPATP